MQCMTSVHVVTKHESSGVQESERDARHMQCAHPQKPTTWLGRDLVQLCGRVVDDEIRKLHSPTLLRSVLENWKALGVQSNLH